MMIQLQPGLLMKVKNTIGGSCFSSIISTHPINNLRLRIRLSLWLSNWLLAGCRFVWLTDSSFESGLLWKKKPLGFIFMRLGGRLTDGSSDCMFVNVPTLKQLNMDRAKKKYLKKKKITNKNLKKFHVFKGSTAICLHRPLCRTAYLFKLLPKYCRTNEFSKRCYGYGGTLICGYVCDLYDKFAHKFTICIHVHYNFWPLHV